MHQFYADYADCVTNSKPDLAPGVGTSPTRHAEMQKSTIHASAPKVARDAEGFVLTVDSQRAMPADSNRFAALLQFSVASLIAACISHGWESQI